MVWPLQDMADSKGWQLFYVNRNKIEEEDNNNNSIFFSSGIFLFFEIVCLLTQADL